MVVVSGAEARYESHIRRTLNSLPSWYVAAARLSRIVVSRDPGVIQQVAAYSHGTRELKVSPGIGTLLERTLAHEIAHGIDDAAPSGSTHRFSRSREWMSVHRNALSFEIPKYRDEPQEYFADMLSKYILSVSGSMTGNSLQRSHPRESEYILQVVIPVLRHETQGKV